MFCARKIELHTITPNLPTALIPREMLADYTQACQLLEHAKAHAQTLIRQAEAQCEAVLQSAGQQFWQRANTLLQRWESERQTMHEHLEQLASTVISNTLRSFLDETPPTQRLTALLNQLLLAQLPRSRRRCCAIHLTANRSSNGSLAWGMCLGRFVSKMTSALSP